MMLPCMCRALLSQATLLIHMCHTRPLPPRHHHICGKRVGHGQDIEIGELRRRLKAEHGVRKACERWLKSELKSRVSGAGRRCRAR